MQRYTKLSLHYQSKEFTLNIAPTAYTVTYVKNIKNVIKPNMEVIKNNSCNVFASIRNYKHAVMV